MKERVAVLNEWIYLGGGCGCADVCVTGGRGPGAGGRGLRGLGQRCGELIANCD